jgi:hypothetical protein
VSRWRRRAATADLARGSLMAPKKEKPKKGKGKQRPNRIETFSDGRT